MQMITRPGKMHEMTRSLRELISFNEFCQYHKSIEGISMKTVCAMVVRLAILAEFIGGTGAPFENLVHPMHRPSFGWYWGELQKWMKQSAETERSTDELIARIKMKISELRALEAQGRKVKPLIEQYEKTLKKLEDTKK